MNLVEPGVLTLGAGVHSAPPNHAIEPDGRHVGYEPAIAAVIAEDLGVPIRWEGMLWGELYPALDAGRIDAVVYNQAMLPERREIVDFTRPYGLFNEAVLVRSDGGVDRPDDLRGRRLGALRDTSNFKLALAVERAVDGVEVVEFASFAPMLEAVRAGVIAALVDDHLFLLAYEGQELRIGFTVATRNPYGIALRKGSPLTPIVNQTLGRAIDSGRLAALWDEHVPGHPFVVPEIEPDRDVEALSQIVRGS